MDNEAGDDVESQETSQKTVKKEAAQSGASGAGENKAYEKDGESEEIDFEVPEKFLKDGKPDFKALTEAYSAIEKWKFTKTEDLLKQLDEERSSAAPADASEYKLPELEGFDPSEMNEHPLTEWYRDMAFKTKMSQEEFEKGVETYAMTMTQPVDFDAQVKALGDNGKQRIDAVAAWAGKEFGENDELMNVVERVAVDASGIRFLEKVMGVNVTGDDGEGQIAGNLTVEDLKQMQADPRYYDPGRRDMAFVKKVEDGYKKLYG